MGAVLVSSFLNGRCRKAGCPGVLGLCVEVGAAVGGRCYFLVSEQESNQRSRLKGR